MGPTTGAGIRPEEKIELGSAGPKNVSVTEKRSKVLQLKWKKRGTRILFWPPYSGKKEKAI